MTNDGHIFISYSRTDGNTHADSIEAGLRDRGYTTWRDVSGVNPGGDFTADLEEAIETASVVVVCITPDSKRRDSFVRREIHYALDASKPVIALRFFDMRPHIGLQNNEWIDFFRGWDAAFTRLLSALEMVHSGEGGYALPVDPFAPYLEAMRQTIERFLQHTVAQPLELTAEDSSEAVSGEKIGADAPRRGMLAQLFSAHDIVGSGGGGETTVFHTFEEAFWRFQGSLLLLGEPGTGKTTTLMTYLLRAVDRRLRDPGAPLPLLGVISNWDSEKQPSLHRWLGGAYPDLRPEMVRTEIEEGRALLVLDGLDELGGPRETLREKRDPQTGAVLKDAKSGLPLMEPERYDPRLRFMQMIHPDYRVVISCRARDYAEIGHRLPLRGAITLRPLDNAQLDAYLRDQPELKAALDRDAELRDMARRPLVLRLFSFAFAGMDADATRRLHDLDGGDLRDAIFKTYVERRLAHERRKTMQPDKFPPELITAVLGRMAMDNAAGQPAGATEWAENLITRQDFRRVLDEFDVNDFIDRCIQLDLLTPGARGAVRFVHRMLRDYYAYSYATARLDDPALYTSERNPAAALAALRDPRAVPALRKLLENPDARMRSAAAHALGATGDASALHALRRAVHDPDETVGEVAVIALGGLGVDALPALLDIRRSPEMRAALRQTAADVLLAFRDRAAVPHLLDALHDSSSNIRWVAARALGQIGDPDAVPGLLHAMRDGDTRVRGEATNALARLGNEAIPPLLETLADADAAIRQLAAQALSKTGWQPQTDAQGARYAVALNRWNNAVAYGDYAVPHLLAALRDEATRGGAAGALGRIGGTALPGLVNALSDADPDVRRTAAGVLGRLKRAEAVPALNTALQDSVPQVRMSAARALAALRDPAAIPALIAALDDDAVTGKRGKRVCDEAANALEKTGTPAALSALEAWRQRQPTPE